MTAKNKEMLKNIATIFGSVGVIMAGVTAVVMPFANDWADERFRENMKSPAAIMQSKKMIDEFLNSTEFKMIANELIRTHEVHEDNFRIDLSKKMEIAPDEVHIELGRMYKRVNVLLSKTQPSPTQ